MTSGSPGGTGHSGLNELMRRIDRKLDIRRGMTLTYDDLALLVTSGAYATLQNASPKFLEVRCREHVAQSRYISEAPSPSIRVQDGTTRSFGTIGGESANEALARAQAILKPHASQSIGSTSQSTAVAPPVPRAAKR